MNHPHAYFAYHLHKLDSNFYMQVDDAILKDYISSLKFHDFIEVPLISLVIQSEHETRQISLKQPLHDTLRLEYLKQFVKDHDVEVRFIMSFSQDSDYSSHVRLVGTLSPHFTYQVIVEELSEFEVNYLFTLQLMLLTYWEASDYGNHPWVSLIER
ncbi:MAG: hypothetical protein KGZ84_02880 [Erysipelotrichia bacterium]|jgi:hypothetical protein|nr:hypothetical protein [Erysipelotrichia bacterium]